jgi:hypothetical protein
MDGTDILIIMLICFFVLIIGIFIISNYNIKLIEKYTDTPTDTPISEDKSCSIVNRVGRDFGGTYCDGLTVNADTIFATDRQPTREQAEIAIRNKLQEECNKNPQCKGFTTYADNQNTVTDSIGNNYFLNAWLKKKYALEGESKNKIYSDWFDWLNQDDNTIYDRNETYHVPIGKLCVDGWGGSLRNHPEFGDTWNGQAPSVGYNNFKNFFKVDGYSDDDPRYMMKKTKDGKTHSSYLNLKTYRCQDKCPAGQGVQATTPEEKDEYGDFKCKECPPKNYSLSHEKECSPCNSGLCPSGTIMIECDPKTGGVVCGPDIGRGELPP